MPDKSSPGLEKRFSRVKQRVSSYFSASPAPSDLRKRDTGSRDVPPQDDEDRLSTSQRPPISYIPVHSTANSIPTHPSPTPQRLTHNLEASAYQNYSSTDLAPSVPLLLPQDQQLTVQGPSQHSPYPTQGTFSHAQNFVVKDSVFIDSLSNIPTDKFMKDLLQHTIIGAEFDSSARDPPPRCHPGTRLAIIQRCLSFIVDCSGKEKLRWVVGPAGVGKSAVMQMVVETAPDGVILASVFLSINGRQDGTKTVMTIAYQLAVKCEQYNQFIRNEITRDPSLLQKSLSVHFARFIVEPFIRRRLFTPSDRFLIAIDGLDECDNPLIQQTLLELISDFCISYPISPISWIVASRPELHITSFFDRAEVKPLYTKEEIEIDSDEARNDVQRFLRDELKKIQYTYPTLKHRREWPSEHEFTRIAAAAGGLFAYASTVVRYIGDLYYRNPSALLRHVLEVIDGTSQDHISGRSHPMAQLDALYARILSNIPADIMVDARKLLLLCSGAGLFVAGFRQQCNVLGLSEDAAYAAICHLHAVVKVPEPHKADNEHLAYFHKSFGDFLLDSQRSGVSHDVRDELNQLMAEISMKIVEQVPSDADGMTYGKGIKCYDSGYLKCGSGSCAGISLSWPGDERFKTTNAELRLGLYCRSMFMISLNFGFNAHLFGNMSCFNALATRFTIIGACFPLDQLRHVAFGELRRELMELGKLKQVPLRTLDYAAICGHIDLHFIMSPVQMNGKLSDHWNASCKHMKRDLARSPQLPDWTTTFCRFVPTDPNTRDKSDTVDIHRLNAVAWKKFHYPVSRDNADDKCNYCLRRFARHFINNPDQPATIFVDSTEMCYVEFSFVDPDDGVSEWTYQFCHSGPPAVLDV